MKHPITMRTLLLGLLLMTQTALAQVYTYIDAEGKCFFAQRIYNVWGVSHCRGCIFGTALALGGAALAAAGTCKN